jgi:hypothetical protein
LSSTSSTAPGRGGGRSRSSSAAARRRLGAGGDQHPLGQRGAAQRLDQIAAKPARGSGRWRRARRAPAARWRPRPAGGAAPARGQAASTSSTSPARSARCASAGAAATGAAAAGLDLAARGLAHDRVGRGDADRAARQQAPARPPAAGEGGLEPEAAPPPRAGVDAHLAVHGAGQPPGDGQAQARAAEVGVRGVGLGEGLEDAVAVGLGDARARCPRR